MSTFPLNDYEFGLCLTHDVDRPYKRNQALYYALSEREPRHLRALLPGNNPWWQFEELTALEEELGVRSAFYFLRQPHLLRERTPVEWLRPVNWVEHLGRYDPDEPAIADVIRRLDEGGWEVGLHGSYGSHESVERLRYEKEALEGILGHEVVGGRQHRLRFDPPETWRYHRGIGLQYDASLGSSSEVGFLHGYDVKRPFDDDFVVFPMTIMEKALENVTDGFAEAREEIERLLREAAENNAVMTVLWHPRNFSEADFPGHARLYRILVERALEMGAWVGPPGELYGEIVSDGGREAAESGESAGAAESTSVRT